MRPKTLREASVIQGITPKALLLLHLYSARFHHGEVKHVNEANID